MEDILLKILFVFLISICLGLFISSICVPFTTIGHDNEILNLKIIEYEKILNKEFGKTFENYNEYLLHKIELGG